MALSRPIEVICLGRIAEVGVYFAHHLSPQVFITHFFSPPDNPAEIIIAILKTPACRISAIVAGAAYPRVEREAIRAQVEGEEGVKEVPWFLAEHSQEAGHGVGAGPGGGPGGGGAPSAGQWDVDAVAKESSERITECLMQCKEQGYLEKRGTYYY